MTIQSFGLCVLLTLAAGCASAPWTRARSTVGPGELLAGAAFGVTSPRPALVEDEVLAVSPEMRQFLDRQVARKADGVTRLRQLTRAIVDESRFGLQYDETTRTAAETFRTRRGNCLSFSNMFVAMARQVGLDASYQEVDTWPDWSLRSDIFVLNRHVDVLVDLGKQGEQVVDFNMADFRTNYHRRRITDARALAHNCNNVAIERMQAGDAASAFRYLRTAVESDPSFSPAWTGLGILYRRNGHAELAEAAYLQALKADGGDLVAMSDLASLYEMRGEHGLAAAYRSRVAAHRQRNPYYHYELAQRALAGGEFGLAIRELERAIRRKKNEDRFYFLLGLSHLKQGDEPEARRWFARAEEVAATDALKRRYADKLEILLAAPPDESRRER